MNNGRKKLSDAELEVMLELWELDAPATSTRLLELLDGKRSWRLATLQTVLSRLEEKGYVRCDRSSRANLYLAAVDEKSYKEQASLSFLQKLHRNSLSGLIASLYDGGAIDENDLEDLRRFIEEAEKREGKA